MTSTAYHEPAELLSEDTKDMHRAIVSLMEELEAVDWYQQRVDATKDASLKAVLAHNLREEIEHAMMNLEWIRRKSPMFDEHARTYLFSEGPITEVEKRKKAEEAGADKK
jgi:ferritin-like protein